MAVDASAKAQRDEPIKAMSDVAIGAVRNYHQRTKHRFEGYARGPDTLDWDSQPSPFRYFVGAESVPLTLEKAGEDIAWGDLVSNEAVVPAQALTQKTLAEFIRYSLALTAWKQFGPDKWSLRINPSSGNLHPTEAYILLPAGLDALEEDEPILTAGLYHYESEQHVLQTRARLLESADNTKGFYVGLTSVTWREAWKYGERSFRYTQLDLGHALACLDYSARALGWVVRRQLPMGSDEMASLLGIDRPEYYGVEGEIPECLVWVGPEEYASESVIPSPSQLSDWQGRPQSLGERSPYKWPVVDQIAAISRFDETNGQAVDVRANQPGVDPNDFSDDVETIDVPELAIEDRTFREVSSRRRSAQRFEQQPLSLKAFFSAVNRMLEAQASDVLGEPEGPSFGLLFAVHRVEGLSPGLYLLPGNRELAGDIRNACRKLNQWHPLILKSAAGSEISMYRIYDGVIQRATATLCCQQAIASDAAFTVGFLADFDRVLELRGSSGYRLAHWQAGFMSQQLYLEATAQGAAATGIGCFFDDPCRDLLGINSDRFQFVYFTAVGFPVVDDRLTSFSGYYHLQHRTAGKQ